MVLGKRLEGRRRFERQRNGSMKTLILMMRERLCPTLGLMAPSIMKVFFVSTCLSRKRKKMQERRKKEE
jgi:hypothetical protein